MQTREMKMRKVNLLIGISIIFGLMVFTIKFSNSRAAASPNKSRYEKLELFNKFSIRCCIDFKPK